MEKISLKKIRIRANRPKNGAYCFAKNLIQIKQEAINAISQ